MHPAFIVAPDLIRGRAIPCKRQKPSPVSSTGRKSCGRHLANQFLVDLPYDDTMVFYLANSGLAVPNYAETDWDFLDADLHEFNKHLEYLRPEEVAPAAREPSAIKTEQGYAIDPATLPKQMLWASKGGPIPDILPRFIVSPRFKQLVEQFEPDTHQFVPIDIHASRDSPPVTTYFWFFVCQRLDSVDREHTTYKWEDYGKDPSYNVWTRRIMDPKTFKFSNIDGAELFFSKEKIAGHHLWVDPHLLGAGKDRLCSQHFGEAALASDFSGLVVSPRKSAIRVH